MMKPCLRETERLGRELIHRSITLYVDVDLWGWNIYEDLRLWKAACQNLMNMEHKGD